MKDNDLAKKLATSKHTSKLEDLLVKAVDMYQYNLEQYPEENPTMIGAIEEILYEMENKE